MTLILAARPTTYNGVQMRSRLEATIAAALDGMEIGWVYEPQAFASPEGQYLPDFYLPDARRMDADLQLEAGSGVYIEVRPTPERAQATLARDTRIMEASHDRPLLSMGFEGQAPTFGFTREGVCTVYAALVVFGSPPGPVLLRGTAAIVHYAHLCGRIR